MLNTPNPLTKLAFLLIMEMGYLRRQEQNHCRVILKNRKNDFSRFAHNHWEQYLKKGGYLTRTSLYIHLPLIYYYFLWDELVHVAIFVCQINCLFKNCLSFLLFGERKRFIAGEPVHGVCIGSRRTCSYV